MLCTQKIFYEFIYREIYTFFSFKKPKFQRKLHKFEFFKKSHCKSIEKSVNSWKTYEITVCQNVYSTTLQVLVYKFVKKCLTFFIHFQKNSYIYIKIYKLNYNFLDFSKVYKNFLYFSKLQTQKIFYEFSKVFINL